MPARDLIDRFGREEDAFLRTEFLAPVAGPGKVRVRISGIVCELAVRDPKPGIRILKPLSMKEAAVVREATRAEAKRYLEIFPRARLVVTLAHGETWMGLPAGATAKGVRVEGLVPIALARGLRLFDTAVVRFDGALFLHESSERPAEGAYLREELAKGTAPDALSRKALTAEERSAYARALEFKLEMEKSADERRLERALGLAGAQLSSFEERYGQFTITFRVDGRDYTSIVSRGDLTVLSSGICLSGRDRDFDLTSLVSVLREHHRDE